jgi:hypothetical protein
MFCKCVLFVFMKRKKVLLPGQLFVTKTLNKNSVSRENHFLLGRNRYINMHHHASSLMISRSPVAAAHGRSCSSSSSSSKNAPKTPSSSQEQRLKNRRDVFLSGTAFSALFLLSSFSSSNQSAHAYGTGGWKDCEPVCDSLKGGFAAQQKLQEELMRQATMGGGGNGGEGGDDVTSSGEQKKGVSEREKRKKNLR